MTLKNIMSQYINHMISNQENVMESLQKFSIVLDIFVSFFYTLLYLGEVYQGDE